MFGLRTFRQCLLGRTFTIRTDHSALQWLRRTPEPMGADGWRTLNNSTLRFSTGLAISGNARYRVCSARKGQKRVESLSHEDGPRQGKTERGTNMAMPTDCRATGHMKMQSGWLDSKMAMLDDMVNDREALTKVQLHDPDIGRVLRSIMHSPEEPHRKRRV